MKKEKGSALLTVILIVAVTTTIGAAIASLILMNYKIRLFDNHVRRAEYVAEEIIDTTLIYLQDNFDNVFNAIAQIMQNEIDEEYNEIVRYNEGEEMLGELKYYSEENDVYYVKNEVVADEYNTLFRMFGGETEVPDIDELDEKFDNVEDEFNESDLDGVDYDSFNVKDVIEAIIKKHNETGDTEYGKLKIIKDEEEKVDNEISIRLDDTKVGDKKITQKVYVYYKIPENAVIKNSPIVEFSLDYVIVLPEFKDVRDNKYSMLKQIGIANWTIVNDWEYLQ